MCILSSTPSRRIPLWVTNTDRVWLIPQKFWSAIKEMSAEQTETLVEQVMAHAVHDRGNIAGFRQNVAAEIMVSRSQVRSSERPGSPLALTTARSPSGLC